MNLSRALAPLLLGLLASCTGPNTKPRADAADTGQAGSLEEACRTVLTDCRGPGSVRLKKEDGSVFELSWALTQPVVQGDTWVTIFPGETIHLEAEVAGDRITKVRAVPKVEKPDSTITLTFEQMDDSTSMMLSVSNPFSRHLKYRLGMQMLGEDALYKTSSCPAIARGGAFEHWGYPIFQLVVTDFRLLPEDSDQMTCE